MIQKWERQVPLVAVSPMDLDDIVKEVDQQIEWFCDKVIEPYPIHRKDKEKIFERMKTLGWIRQSEIDTYNEITKED